MSDIVKNIDVVLLVLRILNDSIGIRDNRITSEVKRFKRVIRLKGKRWAKARPVEYIENMFLPDNNQQENLYKAYSKVYYRGSFKQFITELRAIIQKKDARSVRGNFRPSQCRLTPLPKYRYVQFAQDIHAKCGTRFIDLSDSRSQGTDTAAFMNWSYKTIAIYRPASVSPGFAGVALYVKKSESQLNYDRLYDGMKEGDQTLKKRVDWSTYNSNKKKERGA